MWEIALEVPHGISLYHIHLSIEYEWLIGGWDVAELPIKARVGFHPIRANRDMTIAIPFGSEVSKAIVQ